MRGGDRGVEGWERKRPTYTVSESDTPAYTQGYDQSLVPHRRTRLPPLFLVAPIHVCQSRSLPVYSQVVQTRVRASL